MNTLVAFAPLAALGLVTLTTGCASRNVNFSGAGVATPILLGPVDRVGGYSSSQARTVGRVDFETHEAEISARYYHRLRYAPPGDVARAVSSATQGHADDDIRVTQVEAGAWLLWPLFALREQYWVSVRGDAVRVQP